jgi:hypothetical protein
MKGSKEWETIYSGAIIKSNLFFLIFAFIKVQLSRASTEKLQQMSFGKLFPQDSSLLEIKDLVGSSVGNSMARIRIN